MPDDLGETEQKIYRDRGIHCEESDIAVGCLSILFFFAVSLFCLFCIVFGLMLIRG